MQSAGTVECADCITAEGKFHSCANVGLVYDPKLSNSEAPVQEVMASTPSLPLVHFNLET